MEKPQWGEGSAHVYSVQQDEAEGPLYPLLSPFGHEGWDPQDAATEALQPPQETIPPLFTGQIPEGPLHHGGVHGHQISPPPNIFEVILHWCQVTPTKDTQGFYILILRNTTMQKVSKIQVSEVGSLYSVSQRTHRGLKTFWVQCQYARAALIAGQN